MCVCMYISHGVCELMLGIRGFQVHMHACKHVCVCMCVCMCISHRVCLLMLGICCIFRYTCMHVNMCVYVCAYVLCAIVMASVNSCLGSAVFQVYMHACKHVCVCMCVCMCISQEVYWLMLWIRCIFRHTCMHVNMCVCQTNISYSVLTFFLSQHNKVALWQATIVENALKRLAALNKPFKYVGRLIHACILYAWRAYIM